MKRNFDGKVIMGLFILAALFVTYGFMNLKTVSAEPNTTNLKAYSRNLDVLADKPGNLADLISELQNYRIVTVTGAVLGTTMTVPGLLTSDSILEATVYSSAALFTASTEIGRPGDGRVILQSRIWGNAQFGFKASFVRKSSLDPSSATLSINTTGYSFEVQLASGNNNLELSTPAAICQAINSHVYWGKMVRCSTAAAANSFSTGTLTLAPDTKDQRFAKTLPTAFANNLDGFLLTIATNPFGSGNVPLSVFTINGNFATIPSSGNVVFSTFAPINSSDAVDLKVVGKR